MNINQVKYLLNPECLVEYDEHSSAWISGGTERCVRLGSEASKLIVLLNTPVTFDDLLERYGKALGYSKEEIRLPTKTVLEHLITQKMVNRVYNDVVPKYSTSKTIILTNRVNKQSVVALFLLYLLTLMLSQFLGMYSLLQVDIAFQSIEAYSEVLIAMLVWVFLHELSHYMMAKFVGYRKIEFKLSRGTYFKTITTVIPPQIGITDGKRRFLVSIAGPLADSFILLLLSISAVIFDHIIFSEIFPTMILIGLLYLSLNNSILKGTDGFNAINHLLKIKNDSTNFEWMFKTQKFIGMFSMILVYVYISYALLNLTSTFIYVQRNWPW